MYDEMVAMASARISSMEECMHPHIIWNWLSGSEQRGHGRGSGYLDVFP
jgi:hypothetical protein